MNTTLRWQSSLHSPVNTKIGHATHSQATPKQTSSNDTHAPPGAALGVVTILLTLAGWTSVPLFIVHQASLIDVWTSNGWRYAFAAVLWAPLLVHQWMNKTLPKGVWRAALIPAAFNAVAQTAFAWSFYNIDPATATFGLRLQIVFIVIGAYLMFPAERAVLRSPVSWIGLVMVVGGIGGTLLMADRANLPKVVDAMGSASYAAGVVLAVLAGLLFAAYGLSVRKCMGGVKAVTAFAAISQYTCVLLLIVMFALAKDPVTRTHDFGISALNLSAKEFGILMLSSLIGIALGHVFYYISIARLGVAVSGGVTQLQPFCVALAQLAIFGKELKGGQWVCGCLAVLGAGLLLSVQWRQSRQAMKPTAGEPPAPALDQPD